MIRLNDLILAIQTGEHRYYHGDVTEGVVEALNVLREVLESQGELVDRTDGERALNLDIDEGNRDAVLDFVESVKKHSARVTLDGMTF